MPLAVLDWTADHVRAWNTLSDGVPARPVKLEGERADLALVLFLEKRQFRLGRAGLSVCRLFPQQICQGFFPLLGEAKQWRYGRNLFSPEQAVAAVAAHLREKLTGTKKILATVPAYLREPQVAALKAILQEAGFKVLGLLRRSLSIGLASHWDHPWLNIGVLVDADDHALSCTVLRPDPVDLHLVRQRVFPTLGLCWWRERLLATVADMSIRQNRRDPRAIAEADQLLFDQSDPLLDALSQGQDVTVKVQVGQFVQHLTLPAATGAAACSGLAQQAAQAALTVLTETVRLANDGSVYVTPEAARLPGLAAALYAQSNNQVPVILLRSAAEEAALDLARRIDNGKLPPVDSRTAAVSLAPPLSSEDAPSTLRFPGQSRRASSQG